jgi:thioredoxin 1
MSDVITLSDDNFDREILGAGGALVDFGAAWCGPCRAVAPVVEKLAAEYRGRCRVGALDIEASPAIAERYEVRNIPTLLVFKNGQVVAQLVGAAPRAKIEEALRKAL